MEEKKKSILIAISFIVALFLFIWGFNFLKGKTLLRKQLNFYAIYNNTRGLQPGDIVLINGMTVGQVNSLRFNPKQNSTIIVDFTITNDIMIPDNSVVKIISHIMGSPNLNLVLGDSPHAAKNGDTLLSGYELGTLDMIMAQLLPLKDNIQTLIVSLDSLAENINNMLNGNLKKDINNGINDFATSMKNIRKISSDIQQLIDNKNNNLVNIIDNMEVITNNFSNVSDSLAQIKYTQITIPLENTINELNTLIERINKGEGSAGLLIKENSLYNNINKTVSTLQELLEKIKENFKKLKISIF